LNNIAIFSSKFTRSLCIYFNFSMAQTLVSFLILFKFSSNWYIAMPSLFSPNDL
jgi:hypothetical protein